MTKSDYVFCADHLQESLNKEFWDTRDRIYRHRLPHNRQEAFSYWWQAHAIDVLLDRFLRTEDNTYIEQANELLCGIIAHNGGTLINNWYDDMEWMALALLRMYDVTGDEKLKARVDILWENIKTAWNDQMGGGMAWKKDQIYYKNTPANAPAAILAFRLYQHFGREDDLAWGIKIFEWNRNNLMDPDTYFVWDGMNRLGDGKIDYDWEYSYCQGVMIGAAVEYYRITGDDKQLDLAVNIAKEAKRRFTDGNNGVMPYEGKDDCGLFRGIFFRYLAELIKVAPDVTELRDLLLYNASVVMESGISQTGLVGGDWMASLDETVDLAQDLSGIMLIEMAVEICD